MKPELRAQVHAVTTHNTPKRLLALIALVLALGVVVSQPPVAPAQEADAPAQEADATAAPQAAEDHSDFSADSTASSDPRPTTDPRTPATDPAGSPSSAPSGSDSTEPDSTTPTEARSAQVSGDGPRAIGAQAAQSPVLLGTTESVAVLGGSAVTNTGPSVISGDVDVAPACAVTGFPPGIVINGRSTDATLSRRKRRQT